MKKYKGLLVSVYKMPDCDCTNKGISHDKDQLILVGEGIPEIFEGDETNTVKLVERNLKILVVNVYMLNPFGRMRKQNLGLWLVVILFILRIQGFQINIPLVYMTGLNK